MTAAILLPGIGIPAHVAFGPVMAELVRPSPVVAKELEVYGGDRPAEDYGLDMEVDGLDRFATDQGFDRFHLFGHSIGGAIALAYVAHHPDRVASLALFEPASDFSDADRSNPIAVERASDDSDDQFTQRFLRQLVRPGIEPAPVPPSDDPEMAKRPAGMAAAVPAVYAYSVDDDALQGYRGPTYYAYGTLSSERWETMAERIPLVLGDCTVERYVGRHHLDAPHLAEPSRLATALTTLWKRADGQ